MEGNGAQTQTDNCIRSPDLVALGNSHIVVMQMVRVLDDDPLKLEPATPPSDVNSVGLPFV